MRDRTGAAARKFHEDTKHSFQSVRSGSHFLDFSNQPMPFKVYTDLAPVPLPPEPPRAAMDAIRAVSSGGEKAAAPETLSLETLARLFFLTAGITKKIEAGGQPHYFRAAACTGALYHIEPYLICGDVPGGLSAGVHHLAVHDYSARCLRRGDYRPAIAEALGRGDPPEAAFVFTSTYWRNSWKYRSRAYRHCFWDSGTMLANFLAAAASFGIAAQINTGFADGQVNGLLGVDAGEEASLVVVELGERHPFHGGSPDVAPVSFETAPLSANPIDYPAIREIHEASSLGSGDAVREWRLGAEEFRGETPKVPSGAGEGAGEDEFPVFPLAEGESSGDSIDDVILRRGSARRFGRRPIRFEDLSLLLRAAVRSLPADFLPEGKPALNELFLIVNAVQGLPAGSYYFDRRRDALVQLREGDFRPEAGHLGLDQELAADASVSVYFLSDLEKVLHAFGDRGYRAAQLEAGVMGGKLYLGAYAQGLAASGLTFYDDEVISFFGPRAHGKEVMFLMLLGRRMSPTFRM
ncbi:MAG: SagB/ThcOx family dehydrogenase [bacterium]